MGAPHCSGSLVIGGGGGGGGGFLGVGSPVLASSVSLQNNIIVSTRLTAIII